MCLLYRGFCLFAGVFARGSARLLKCELAEVPAPLACLPAEVLALLACLPAEVLAC